MEIKKNPEVDLEKKRSLFLVAGYVVALAVVLTAFEWKTYLNAKYLAMKANIEEPISMNIQALKPVIDMLGRTEFI